MSLKQEIETWVAALAHYDNNEFDQALQAFDTIADTSKILFNCGVIYATLGEHTRAVDCYQRAVQLDQYLAVAYFQQGVSNFLMGDFEEALANFNDTLLYLRGNNNIDYEQLGLKFKLFSCEVLFNRGLCYIYLQQKEVGMQDLMFAAKEKMVPDHDVIDEAIREQAEGYTVFSIPVGIIYRPNEAKVKNLKTKDYLGKARLVASQDQWNVDARRNAALAAVSIDDRPDDKLSYGALNLVRPNLTSRSRQQSEPPIHRNMFPPTPPPEAERPDSSHSRRKSSESTRSLPQGMQQSRPLAQKPSRLELGAAAFKRAAPPEKPRLGTVRSASERPQVRREYSGSSTRSHEGRKVAERRSQRETPSVRIEEDPIEAYSQQVSPPRQSQQQYHQPQPQQQQQQHLQPQAHHQRSKSNTHASRNRPVSIEEAEDEDDSPTDSPLAFEIIPPRPSHHMQQSRSHRAPEMRKIRIKVHAEDTRYVMTTPDVIFADLVGQIRAKLGLNHDFKVKMKDEEGDMITMGDQDDLDQAIGVCTAAAAKEKADMGKMDVWVQ